MISYKNSLFIVTQPVDLSKRLAAGSVYFESRSS